MTTMPFLKAEPDAQLPVEICRKYIVEVVKSFDVLIVLGQTGCGKSTMIPQILYDEGIVEKDTKVCITQPRRVAAYSLARKVATDREQELGGMVGYKVRFENKTSKATKIVYLTDGMLLKEMAHDRNLSEYSVVILDEVHERSVATDVLLYLLRKLITTGNRKEPLKVILMSATIDVKPLKKYFHNAPAFFVPGRLHSVDIYNCDSMNIDDGDYAARAIKTVQQLHKDEPLENTFLVFLTGEEEVESCCRNIRQLPDCTAIPFYGRLDSDYTRKALFSPPEKSFRKIIVATNIAETSITIPDVRVVIDTGKVKQKQFDFQKRIDSLIVVNVSQASANQRAGRAGRTGPGKCYRLYSEAAFNNFLPDIQPEIKRTNLSATVLHLFFMGLNDVPAYNFIDPPTRRELGSALTELVALNLLTAKDKRSVNVEDSKFFTMMNKDRIGLKYEITEKGRMVAQISASPTLGCLLYEASKLNCIANALTVAAFASVEDIFHRKADLNADRIRQGSIFLQNCASEYGDHVRFIHVFNHVRQQVPASTMDFCHKNGIVGKNYVEAVRIRKQLREECKKAGIPVDRNENDDQFIRLRTAIARAFFLNTIMFNNKASEYTLAMERQTVVQVHPGSCLFRKHPPTMVFTEMIKTKCLYARNLTQIDRDIIRPLLDRINVNFRKPGTQV